MFEKLAIALGQVKEGNNSESLLDKIRQIVYSLHQSKIKRCGIYYTS